MHGFRRANLHARVAETGASPGLLDPTLQDPYSRPMTTPSSPLRRKEAILFESLERAGRVLVAFSGGVDSSYLAWAARSALGKDCLAVTALSPSYPAVQREMAERVARQFDIPHRLVDSREMAREAYRANAPDRCYHCKSELFDRLGETLSEIDGDCVAYGINCDDRTDFRPGHRAAAEHEVLAPLLDAGLCKEEIRELSRAAGLPTADLPSSACLASRLPYGTRVTSQNLSQVEMGEDRVRALGFRQVRLRYHGELARIEIGQEELERAMEPDVIDTIVRTIRELGFQHVELDPEGYRTGSLNESLTVGQRRSQG